SMCSYIHKRCSLFGCISLSSNKPHPVADALPVGMRDACQFEKSRKPLRFFPGTIHGRRNPATCVAELRQDWRNPATLVRERTSTPGRSAVRACQFVFLHAAMQGRAADAEVPRSFRNRPVALAQRLKDAQT